MKSQLLKYLTCIALILFGNSASAEGPPIDTLGNIRCAYISIKLTPAQLRHIQKSRMLTLTATQLKLLAPYHIPKTVDVVDPYYDDCTCAMIYCMWYKADEVAFQKESADEDIAGMYKNQKQVFDSKCFYLGLKGEVFFGGKPITMKKLDEIIAKRKAKGEKQLWFWLPPSLGNPNHSSVLKTRTAIRKRIPTEFNAYWGKAYNTPDKE